MALTTKIKVNQVQAGDPHLSFTLESDDGGTFPDRVRVAAVLNSSDLVNTYYGDIIQSGGSAAPINFIIQFPDSNYANETTLFYTLTIYFPDSTYSIGWAPFGGLVDHGTGTVAASHSGGGPDIVKVVEKNA